MLKSELDAVLSAIEDGIALRLTGHPLESMAFGWTRKHVLDPTIAELEAKLTAIGILTQATPSATASQASPPV